MIKIRGDPLHVMVLLPLYVRAIQPKPPEIPLERGEYFCL